MATQIVDRIVIAPQPREKNRAIAQVAGCFVPCFVGRGTIGAKRREGDGITPLGIWRIRYFLYNPDRLNRPKSLVPGFPLSSNDGWCDASFSRHYNRPVALSQTDSKEELYRKDSLYDLVVVLDHNQKPAVKNRGSAVFLHLATSTTSSTEGCIAFHQSDLIRILSFCKLNTMVVVRR